MDNGLIFPYPRNRAHGESVILTLLKRPFAARLGGVWLWMQGT